MQNHSFTNRNTEHLLQQVKDTRQAPAEVNTALDVSATTEVKTGHNVSATAEIKTNLLTSTVPNLEVVPKVTIEPSLPFVDEDLVSNPAFGAPAQPMVKPSELKNTIVVLPKTSKGEYQVFVDKILPPLSDPVIQNEAFSSDYFVALNKLVSAEGPTYPTGTPNYMGARIPLQHTPLKLDRWRHHLIGYEHVDICQLLEFGFPLGLQEEPIPIFESSTRNHSSSYQFYKWIDEFIQTGITLGDVAGPFSTSPYTAPHISPLMTAEKKPSGRRAVFDATFGDMSSNNNTPTDVYLGQPIEYSFPKIDDFKQLVLKSGRGCFIWKRDLSRYYLQIPLDS